MRSLNLRKDHRTTNGKKAICGVGKMRKGKKRRGKMHALSVQGDRVRGRSFGPGAEFLRKGPFKATRGEKNLVAAEAGGQSTSHRPPRVQQAGFQCDGWEVGKGQEVLGGV